MSDWVVRTPPNPCTCGHSLNAHSDGVHCIECNPRPTGNAHAFSPMGYVYPTPKTLSSNP